jgi:hypothetical protein
MTRIHLLPLSLFLLGLCACGGQRQEAPAAATPSAAAPAAPVATGEAAPAAPAQEAPAAPIGPISSRGETVPPAALPTATSIHFDVPADWKSERPETNMRLAQATIPGPGGPGNFAVFYFGPGGGGGVNANIERWIGQMETGPGVQPRRDSFDTNDLRVSWVDVTGTLKPSGMGMGPTTPQPNSRLLGAVVEGPGGPWFFKATGPEATLAPQRDAFMKMLKNVRRES